LGTGNLSATTVSSIYDIEIIPRRIPYKKETTQGFTEPDFKDALEDDVEIAETPIPIPGARPIQLRVVDTPGLDDSKAGKDDDHIIDILRTAERVDSITGVVFVVNSTNPFTQSFMGFLKYYRELLPKLSEKFFLVHSNFGYKQV